MINILSKKETKETQTLVTLEDWLKGIKRIKTPQDETQVLLSDWPLADKIKVLLLLPKKAIRNTTGMRILETRLEDSRHIQLAQVVRWLSFWNLPRRSLKWNLEWSHHMILGDIGMRWIVQMEVYIQVEVKALRKSLALSTKNEKEKSVMITQLRDLENLLERLNNEYWTLGRMVGLANGLIPAGALNRAFKSWRADPDWYLCDWLRQDCANRGGCCGRRCGCCEKARTTSRQWNRGHCTTLCGRCIRTQKRSCIESGQSELEDISTVKVSYMSEYSARINRAYIWGLTFLDDLGLL